MASSPGLETFIRLSLLPSQWRRVKGLSLCPQGAVRVPVLGVGSGNSTQETSPGLITPGGPEDPSPYPKRWAHIDVGHSALLSPRALPTWPRTLAHILVPLRYVGSR